MATMLKKILSRQGGFPKASSLPSHCSGLSGGGLARKVQLYSVSRSSSSLHANHGLFGSSALRVRHQSTHLAGGPNKSPISAKEQNRPLMSQQRMQEQDESEIEHLGEAWKQNLTGDETVGLDGCRDITWYTGKAPLPGMCPGVSAEGVIRSLPTPNLNAVTRQSTQEYFDNTWTLYETLFSGLNGEDTFYRPPIHGLRHPQIFYFGHTACLYINKMRVAGILTEAVDAELESILETGVDEMLWDDMSPYDTAWPTVSRVHEYRKKVYDIICHVIATHPELDDANGPVQITDKHQCWSLFMGFEHDRIHLETSSVLFREMPLHAVQVPVGWPAVFTPSEAKPTQPAVDVDFPVNPMLAVAGQTVVLGKPHDFPSYGWDNEYGRREIAVPDFEASKHMITNGEMWQFVAQNGYQDSKYWCEEGWGWRTFRNAKWPAFWSLDGPQGAMQFKLRNVFEITDMTWSAPVEVNMYEAMAYCRWKSEQDGIAHTPSAYRMITEAEHHLIRPAHSSLETVTTATADMERALWAEDKHHATGPSEANFNLSCGSAVPVDNLKESKTGHTGAMGNLWEWCEDHFSPLEGFQFHHVYTDFSTPCFDGKHNMIMGGSFISTGIEAGTHARFAFRPHFLQHSGFRMVSSLSAAPATLMASSSRGTCWRNSGTLSEATGGEDDTDNVYETSELVNQYLGMHFALCTGEEEGVPAILAHDLAPTHALRFPQRVAELLTKLQPERTNGRALDVGCAVGGSAFEMATQFDHVTALDFSAAFVNAAKEMQTQGSEVKFNLPVEADLSVNLVAKHEPHVDDAARQRCLFQTGDACSLDPDTLGTFDGAVLANLLCRVPEPLKALDGLAAVMNKGGVVVLATPFSWLEQYTPREKWLGGYVDPTTQEAVYSKHRLQQEMEQRGFVKIHEEQMPALIREHQRKYQYIVSEASGWRKMT